MSQLQQDSLVYISYHIQKSGLIIRTVFVDHDCFRCARGPPAGTFGPARADSLKSSIGVNCKFIDAKRWTGLCCGRSTIRPQ